MHSILQALFAKSADDVVTMLLQQFAASSQVCRLRIQPPHLSIVLHTQALQDGWHTGIPTTDRPPNGHTWSSQILLIWRSGLGAENDKCAHTPANTSHQEAHSTHTAPAHLALWHWGWGC